MSGPNRTSMKIIVCGGREYDNKELVWGVLDDLHEQTPISLLIHGAAPGADALAAGWAVFKKVPIKAYPAQWRVHGKAAGPIRNAEMLVNEKPDLVVAFPGGVGTADMKRQAAVARVEVMECWDEPGQSG